MNIKTKTIFSAALAAVLIALPRVHAVTSDTPMTTNAPTVTDTATATNNKPADVMAALFGDPVIAKGKGFEIKQSQLDEVVSGIKGAAEARGQTIPPDQMAPMEAQMLKQLIQMQLLMQKATDADKAEGKKKTDTQFAAMLENAGSQARLDGQLKAVGMSEDEFRTKIAQKITAMVTLQRELGVTVSDAEINTFYSNHSADFEVPEKVHVRHILLLTVDPTTRMALPADQLQAKRKQIDDILKRARAGEDFAKLAEQYSEDPGSKDEGGELPPFAHASADPANAMDPAFEAAAFSLTNNQISDVITSQWGYHIIKLLDKTPATKLALTDKLPSSSTTVGENVRDYMVQQKMGQSAEPYLEKLMKSADVEILDANLKAAMDSLTNVPATVPAQ